MFKPAAGYVHFASKGLSADALRVRWMDGVEEISRLYRFEVEIEPTGDPGTVEDNLEAMLDNTCVITLEGAEVSQVWGVIRTINLHNVAPNGIPTYRVTVVPRLFGLDAVERTRIFQNKTVPEILAQVLKEQDFVDGTDFSLSLVGRYPKREYTVQWDETDFAFLSRWLEFEGISYYFEHSDTCEKVVFVDTNKDFRKIDAHQDLPYVGSGGLAPDKPIFSRFVRTIHQHTQEVVLLDYNWRNPVVPLMEASPVVGGRVGVKMIFDEHFREAEQGKRLAEVRSQEQGTKVATFSGTTSVTTLRAGDLFELQNHTLRNLDGAYLLVRIRHAVRQLETAEGAFGELNLSYQNEIDAIEQTRPFRPDCRTPRPRIDGLIYATVDGPDTGVAAPIDTEGRYKVVLAVDMANALPGAASRWIRMAQPLAGPSYGMHFPLRVGTEVVLAHVYGDPDRPIIVGAVPNALTPSPVAQSNATQSVIQTMTGIRIEFEDSA